MSGPTDEELEAWAAGQDLEAIRKSHGRSGIAASSWATQAVVVGFASIFLAFSGSPLWLLLDVPSCGFLIYRASRASPKAKAWNRLYGGAGEGEDADVTRY